MKALHDAGVPALVADGLMRRRDERFADQARYKALPDPLYDKAAARKPGSQAKFEPADFTFERDTNTCICPAGKKLYSSGSACTTNGRRHHKFKGTKRDCVPCDLRNQCLRHPEQTAIRQVAFFEKNTEFASCPTPRQMKQAIDSERGRKLYREAARNRRARVRQPEAQQAAGPLNAAHAA